MSLTSDSTSEPFDPHTKRPRYIRLVIYTHLAAVAISLMFSLADRSLFINRQVSRAVIDYLFVVYMPALLSVLLFPLLMLILLAKRYVRGRAALLALIAELILVLAHFAVGQPAVS